MTTLERRSSRVLALAACALLCGAVFADDKKLQKAPKTTPPSFVPVGPPNISLQQWKSWISCTVNHDVNAAAPSKDLAFTNDTGRTLPTGTRIDWEVSGTPASCCKGTAATPGWTWKGETFRLLNVLFVGQKESPPCKAWYVIPRYSADYSPGPVPALAANQTVNVSVHIENRSSVSWPANGAFRLSYHWYQGANAVVFDGARTLLPAAVQSGAGIAVLAKVTAPPAGGIYTLKWDMVEENVTWFSWKGVPTKDQTMAVAP